MQNIEKRILIGRLCENLARDERESFPRDDSGYLKHVKNTIDHIKEILNRHD